MLDIPLNKRGTIRSLANAINVPQTTIFRKVKAGEIRRVSSVVRPLLTEKNKLARLKYCLSKLTPDGHFHDFLDAVHVDEKWFYLQQTKRSYYLLPHEALPYRTCQSKRFIPKIMFMAAVARPRYDHHRKCWFNGKIGIWPFITRERAQRNSKNRMKGTIVTKASQVFDRAACTNMLVEKVYPAIRAKFPRSAINRPIRVQQDNAKPHASPEDAAIVAAGRENNGCRIELECQPANSPDFNVNDLAFFNSIQSLQQKEAPRTVDDLIEAVQKAFNRLDRHTLDSAFVTLQKCLECTMMDKGGNAYKLPHLKKARLRNKGGLPRTMLCALEAIEIAKSCIRTPK